MKKLKRFIHRIKRHRRNKKISRFADNVFLVSRTCSYKIGLNPLVYEIIRSRYYDRFIMNLFPDYMSADNYSEFLIFVKGKK